MTDDDHFTTRAVHRLRTRLRDRFPLGMAFISLFVMASDRLGARVSNSRRARIAVLVLVGAAVLAQPAAAQVNCAQGILGFLGAFRTLSIQAMGLVILGLIALGVILRAIPIQGFSRAGNVLIGGVIGGVVILVVAVTIIDIASAFTTVDLSPACQTGGA